MVLFLADNTGVDVESSMMNVRFKTMDMSVIACVLWYAVYIGESVINVNLRMNIHGRGESVSKIAISGFKNACPGSKFTIQMLKKLPGNGFRFTNIDYR